MIEKHSKYETLFAAERAAQRERDAAYKIMLYNSGEEHFAKRFVEKERILQKIQGELAAYEHQILLHYLKTERSYKNNGDESCDTTEGACSYKNDN